MVLYSQCHVHWLLAPTLPLRQVFALIAWGIFTTNIAEIVRMVNAALPTYSSLG